MRVIKFSPLFSLCCWVNNCGSLFTCLSTGCFGRLDLVSPNGCIRVAVYKKTSAYWPTIWKIRLYLCHVFFFFMFLCVCHICCPRPRLGCLNVSSRFACVLLCRSCSVLSCPSNPGLSMRWGTEEGIKAVIAAAAGAPTPAVHGKTNKDTCW